MCAMSASSTALWRSATWRSGLESVEKACWIQYWSNSASSTAFWRSATWHSGFRGGGGRVLDSAL